eukprot:s857_g17.t1
MKQCGFLSRWSVPLADRVERLDSRPSLRGKASGVAMFSRWPIRHIHGTIDDEILASSRLAHLLLEIGDFQLQCVVIYGMAQSGMDKQNRDLVLHALRAVDHFHLPYVILGDFNCSPLALLEAEAAERQLTDLRTLHLRQTGTPMPPTCKGVTTPDNTVMSPQAARWIESVQVCPPGDFDTHQVVLFRMVVPVQDLVVYHLPLPKPWHELDIDENFMPQAYEAAVARLGVPADLPQWGEVIECAADLAFRQTQLSKGIHPTQISGLPKAFRGRCKPRKPEKKGRVLLTKPGRQGDYARMDEVVRKSTQAKVKQVRRVQALHRRTMYANKQTCYAKWSELQQEWHAILRSKAFGRSFIQWCQHTPELGPPSWDVPSGDYIFTLLQLLLHLTDVELAFDKKLHVDRQKYLMHLDRRYRGSSRAYKSIQESAMPPLTEMRTPLTASAVVAPQDDGTVLAYCDHAASFDLSCPAVLHGVPCTVLARDQYAVTLRPSDELGDLPESVDLTQDRVVADPQAMLRLLTDFWTPYWNSDNPEPDAAARFEAFLRDLPQVVPGPAVNIDSEECWMRAVKALKPNSARGSDAVSAHELQQLPGLAICHLKDVMLSFTQGLAPEHMLAITVAIPKVADIPHAGQIRPITILPQVYRLWARVATRQILDHLSQHMPVEVSGLLRSRGPCDAFVRQQFYIETCHWMERHVSGVCIDLLKCFNTIGRPAVFQAMLWLGIPLPLLQQWFGSLQNMSRLWKLGEVCTPLIPSNHGVPEGDSWSVVCILTLAYTWILSIRQRSSCFVSAYADNWSWAADTVTDHEHVLRCTGRFAALTDMVVDWPKCWGWATNSAKFQVLLSALANMPQAHALQRKLSAMDLGAQHTYQGGPKLGKFHLRLTKAHQRLLRLQHAMLPLSTKVQLIKGAVFPVAFYGAEVLPLGESHCRKLRTALSGALLGPSTTRNPALAMLAIPHMVDPQLELLIRAIRTMKRLYHSLTPDECELLTKMTSRHSGLAYQCRGPAGCFAFYMSKLGWKFTSACAVQVDPYVTLPLLTTADTTFKHWAMDAWSCDVLQLHSDRKHMRMLRINVPDTRQVLASFSDADQFHLAQDMALSHQTEVQKSRWAPDADGKCRYCDADDSRFHRIFECPAAQEVRDSFQECLTFLLDNGREFHDLPFLLRPTQYEVFSQLHYCQHEAAIPDDTRTKLHGLCEEGFVPTFYTDGSLLFPESNTCRHGAYSIILDSCTTDEERAAQARSWRQTGIFPASLLRLSAAKLGGHQSIYRAELHAVVCLCEWVPCARVKTDSASVLATFERCQHAHGLLELRDLAEQDLVARLWISVQSGHYDMHKVKSHQDVLASHTDLEVYDILGNVLADTVANSTCRTLHPEIALLAESMHREVQEDQKFLRSFYQYLLSLRKHFACLQANEQEQPVHDNMRTDVAPSPQHVLRTWSIQQPWPAKDPGVCFFQFSPWGIAICQALLQWMQAVQWEATDEIREGDVGVSWLELMLSFTFSTGILLPIKRALPSGVEYLQQFDDWPAVSVYTLGFGEQTNNFTNLLLQVRKLVTVDIWPNKTRGFTRSLYLLGSRQQHYGYLQRACFPFQVEVIDFLRGHFVHQGLDAFPVLPVTLTKVDSRALTKNWQKALKTVAKGYNTARDWRRRPQRGRYPIFGDFFPVKDLKIPATSDESLVLHGSCPGRTPGREACYCTARDWLVVS